VRGKEIYFIAELLIRSWIYRWAFYSFCVAIFCSSDRIIEPTPAAVDSLLKGTDQMSAYFRKWMLVVPSALLALSASPVMAATATLTGSNGCTYTGYVADANGNLTITCSGGVTNPTDPGTVQLSSSSYSVAAGGIATITLSRTVGTAGAMTVPVSVSGGTAVAGTNYTAPPSSVTMNDGVATVSFTISTTSNSAGPAWSPSTKTVGITLGTPSIGTLGGVSSANLTINDNFSANNPNPPVPANCTIVPVTWDERLSLTFHPKSKMPNGQMFAFKKALNPTSQTYASVDYASTAKYMSISRNPCEFTAELEAAFCGKGARGNDVNMPYGPNPGFGVCQVGTGDYYINVRNSSTRDGADNCPVGQECEYYLSW
jgi:hypothetical protein